MSFYDNDTSLITTNRTSHSTNLLLQTSLWSVRILCPIFIIICPISNWACIRIFQSRIYARSSSKWYFIFIAIFDTIYVLVTAPLLFLITLHIYILNQHVLLCKSIVFLNYLSCQISAGLLACLSIDRLFATSCLSLYRQNCTTNFSRTVCLFVIVIFSIVNSHYLIGYSIDSQGFCSMRHYKWYEINYSRLNVVYLLSYSIIPFTIITICNICIVLSVCQNKTNMKKKYEIKKSALTSQQQAEHSFASKSSIKVPKKSDETFKFDEIFNGNQAKSDVKHVLVASIKDDKVLTHLLDANTDWNSDRNTRLSERLLLNVEETSTAPETPPLMLSEKNSLAMKLSRERSFSSPSNSQKMCIQLQITLSLLAISISFIFCTLPNCISTIMIQTYTNDEHARQFWQAMNYFSVVPLLATHSVNLLFYYLSSNMFRERFREYYFNKKS